jgi:hypothetical protein
VEISQELKDSKLVAKVRDLIRREHAGFIVEGNRCIEPGCSCGQGLGPDGPDPVSGPFRDKPVRCTSFEELVLPLTVDERYDPETLKRFGGLSDTYWAHLNTGETMSVPRCVHAGCRREAQPGSAYCPFHTVRRAKSANREALRARKERRALSMA